MTGWDECRSVARWRVGVVAGALLIGGYFGLPTGSALQSGYGNAIAVLFVGAMVVGARRDRSKQAAAWWLFALGTLFSVIGDSIGTGYLVGNREVPFPSLADVAYLAAYPVLFVAADRLTRGWASYQVRARRLDAAMVSVAALALAWRPLLHEYAYDSSLGLFAKLTLVAYPVMDVALVYVLLSRFVGGIRWRRADALVACSFAVMMIGDLAYDLLELHGTYRAGQLVDASWPLGYLLLAAAALHPSVRQAADTRSPRPPGRRGLAMIGAAALVPAGALLAYSVAGVQVDVPAFALLAVVMAVLAMVRMAGLFGGLRKHADELHTRTVELEDALLERERLAADLRYQAFHDPLTGLANRALLEERLVHALAAARRDGSQVALVVCDLDGFKTINDSLGHQAGDELLKAAGHRLLTVVRAGDTVARLGGDEFALLLEHVPDAATTHEIADRIVTSLAEPVVVAGELVAVSASVGVAFADPDSATQLLVSDADAAMYEAKSGGRNRYAMFETSMRRRVMERMQFATEFAGALEHGEFRLVYQPSYSLADNTLSGFEALIRWRHPRLGDIAPARFLPMAEETGFLLTLGRWILATACADAASWPAQPDGAPTLAVNISAGQLQDRQFAADIRTALRCSGLPGNRLVLEITEGMLFADRPRILAVLDEIKQLGVRIAIDNFGTGYSSLNQLRELPIDFVKIDRSYVEKIDAGDPTAKSVVDAILRLARDLDLITVAEGIESGNQWAWLTANGCNRGQGYLLSHPLEADNAAMLTAMKTSLHPVASRNG